MGHSTTHAAPPDNETGATNALGDPIFEAAYPYESFAGVRQQRLGLFDNPDSAYQCLSDEDHLEDGEIHQIDYVYGIGPAGSRAVIERRKQIFGERPDSDTGATERGWLDRRDEYVDPDHLRFLELKEMFAPFIMWRQRYERNHSATRAQVHGRAHLTVHWFEARGEVNPHTGVGGTTIIGRFETPEQAIDAVQGKGLAGGPGFVVMVELFDTGFELCERRTGVWGLRRRLDSPGYEFGYSDYRDYYTRADWLEFVTLAEKYT